MEKAQTHILIVEDSKDDRDVYAQYLSRKGYRVSIAGDGKEGLEKAFELHPHLILLDLWLPIIGGWEATRRLQADERTKDCPVVVITGHVWHQPRTPQCAGWLTKPCPLDQLDAEIARVLEPGA
jgi:two-component system cell cycle response regulator DivK